MEQTHPALLRFGIAVGSVAVALQSALLLKPILAATPDAPFFAAVAVASWYGGLLPGLLATVMSALAVDYFLVPPLYSIQFDADHAVRLAVFLVVSLLISWTSHMMQRAREQAAKGEADARHELAERQRAEAERVALLARER
jgi:K+-sensing histidine kinase KdpD